MENDHKVEGRIAQYKIIKLAKPKNTKMKTLNSGTRHIFYAGCVEVAAKVCKFKRVIRRSFLNECRHCRTNRNHEERTRNTKTIYQTGKQFIISPT